MHDRVKERRFAVGKVVVSIVERVRVVRWVNEKSFAVGKVVVSIVEHVRVVRWVNEKSAVAS